MPVTGTLPYDLNNILGGAARVVISDDSVSLPAIPANINDVVDCETPYATKTGWVDIGATAGSTDYTRTIESSGFDIQQATGVIFEDVTDTQRTMKVEIAEIKPEFIKIVEEAPSIATIAAIAGETVAQKGVKFGSIPSLTSRRVCFVAQRNKRSGLVTETTGSVTRGRFVMLALYNVTLSADATQVQVEKGNLASMPVTLKAFPEDGQSQGQEFGTWLLEDAGTIS